VRLAALVAVAHEARLPEHVEMFGDGRLRHAGARGQAADSLLAISAEALEQRPPRRIGKCSEQYVVRLGRYHS
jgi:hypothetical protein